VRWSAGERELLEASTSLTEEDSKAPTSCAFPSEPRVHHRIKGRVEGEPASSRVKRDAPILGVFRASGAL